MSIFKNLSNQDKKRLIKELDRKPNGIGYNEKVATNIHWLIWKNNDYHLTEDERFTMQFPKPESIIEVRMKEVEGISCEKVEKVLQINKVLNNEKYPAIKIADYYYNAHYVKLGFSLMDKNKEVKFMLNDSDYIRQSKGKIPPALTMTDGDISIMIMPLRIAFTEKSDREKVIDPDSISLEDVKKARKYKVYLEGKAGKNASSEYYLDDQNVILKRKEFFVVIPKENEFFTRVFNMPKNESEYNEVTESDTAGLFEVDPEQHKNTEDLFHKKVAYFKNITHGNFWHFYENGTGVCFNA